MLREDASCDLILLLLLAEGNMRLVITFLTSTFSVLGKDASCDYCISLLLSVLREGCVL